MCVWGGGGVGVWVFFIGNNIIGLRTKSELHILVFGN